MMWNELNVKKNVLLFYIYSSLGSFDFTRGIFILFLINKGLTYAQVGVLQTLLFWSSLVFEVPAGFLADRIKRKYSVAIGLVGLCLVGVLSILSNSFWAFAFIFILNGLGFAFKSGADSALLYDGLKEAGESWLSKHVNILANSRNIGTISMALAIALGGLLQKTSWNLVYGLFALSMILCAITILNISEPHRNQSNKSNETNGNTREIGIIEHLKEFVLDPKGKSLIVFLIGMGLIEAAHTPFFIYMQILLKNYDLSEFAVGSIISLSMVVTSLAYFLISKFPQLPIKRKISLLTIPVSFLMISFSLKLPVYVVIPFFFLINTIPNFMFVFTDHYINEQIPSKIRATFLSVQSFVNSLFISMSYLIGGYLMDHYPSYIVLSLLGVLPIIGLIVLYCHFRFNQKEAVIPVCAIN